MKHILIYIFVSTVLIFGNETLSAQQVRYDYNTQTLTIFPPDNNGIQLKKGDVPKDIQDLIEWAGENNDDYWIPKNQDLTILVDSSQIEKYDSLVLHEWVTLKQIKVAVVFIHKSSGDADMADDDSNLSTPFYKNFVFYIVLGGTVLLLFTAVVAYKRKNTGKESKKDVSSSIQVAETVTVEYTNGLRHIYDDIANYYELDMEKIFSDTAVKKIFLSRNVIKDLNTFFKNFLDNPERTNETGCYLIGCWETVKDNPEQYNISVEEIVIPGDDAIYGEYSLNFGLKIGVKLGSTLRNLSEKTGRNYVHTAWMHSHPGLGLFLSSHDIVVQKMLAYSEAPKRMIAFVIDTNTPDWQTAVFSSKNNGEMNNKEDLMNTISFDILNNWARQKKTVEQMPSNVSMVNTFIVPSDTSDLKFAFAAKAINQIDDLTYSDSDNSIYYLHGTTIQKDRTTNWVISSCDNNKSNDTIGCFKIGKIDNATDSNALDASTSLAEIHIEVIYHSEDAMAIICRSKNGETIKANTSLKEMREWTRRKRI